MSIIRAENYNVKISTLRRNTTFKTPQKWDVIVNHITEGLMPGTLNWLTNVKKVETSPGELHYAAEVSCHFLVTRKGEIYQLADLHHGTWHALKRSPSARIVKERSAPPNLYTVGIEHEGVHKDTQGRLTAAQYEATLWLHKYIIEQYEATFKEPFLIDREHILGHYEVDAVNRSITDPGREFPWEELLTDLIKWDKERKQEVSVMDEAQKWAVENGLVKDEDWKGPISKHTMVWILFSFFKRVLKK
ncbi:N-acetylmuramoyl-L-alanine amidase [anaerobic digester metagenome]